MRKSLIILVLLISGFGMSQTNKDYIRVSELFLKYYNAEQYDSIFNLYDPIMKEALPLDKTIAVLDTQIRPYMGQLKEMAFRKQVLTAFIFKNTFENGLLDMSLSLNKKGLINGFYFSQHIPEGLSVLERNSTEMQLPFNGEWYVFWGGTEIEDNYHLAYNNQKFAYDLGMTRNGKTFKGDRTKNENFYVFGEEILAPCNAKIIEVIDGVPDNVPGEMNPSQVTGNTVVLETNDKEYILMAHFKLNSIVVKEGQEVKQGELLGLCGNSGNSSEPHLHISLQNVDNMSIATGGKLFFSNILVNGEPKDEYIPKRNDLIRNQKN